MEWKGARALAFFFGTGISIFDRTKYQQFLELWPIF